MNATALTFRHHELRTGRVANVPRHLAHSLKQAVAGTVEAAHQARRYINLEGTPFQLFADYSAANEGNAYLVLSPSRRMCEGRVEVGSVLYTAVVSVELATSPVAWRHILSRYTRSITRSAPGHSFGSWHDMPKKLPWLVGFDTDWCDFLRASDCDLMRTVVRLAGARLIAICEQEVSRAKASGAEFEPDPEEYYELREL